MKTLWQQRYCVVNNHDCNMVAIGLLDIPPEMQLQIAEFVETSKMLKALSVTCRSLLRIAQSLLFDTFRIDLGMPLRGSIDDLLANPGVCAAIRSLEVGQFSSLIPNNNNEQMRRIGVASANLESIRRLGYSSVDSSLKGARVVGIWDHPIPQFRFCDTYRSTATR